MSAAIAKGVDRHLWLYTGRCISCGHTRLDIRKRRRKGEETRCHMLQGWAKR